MSTFAEIHTDGLEFGYSSHSAVIRGLSVAFGPGRTVLLGPNGAGKSTLLRLMCGLLRPQRGTVSLAERARPPKQLAREVGFMPQDVAPLSGLSVLEAVQYAAWLGGASGAAARTAAAGALVAVGLQEQLNQKSTRLSGGQLRRLGLACALTRTGQVLLLDEPTAGLDPAQRYRFREVLAELPPELTVVVSTHQLDDVEDIYDQVRVIARGQLRWQGTPDELLALAPGRTRQQAEEAYLALVGEDG
jgi:ABC-type multidrug transport system ATPase subunit